MRDTAKMVGQAEPDMNELGRWMLDKHRAGDTVEALSMFRRARDRGLPLEPQLSDLHRRMLYEDPALTGDHEPAWPAPRQLPATRDRFVGRVDELAALNEQVAGPALGIAGPGGVGKTTLAVHWANGIAERFRDGQIYLDLGGGGVDEPLSPSRALDRVLRSLGVPDDEMPGDEDGKSTLYCGMVEQRRVLVVLDNAAGDEQISPMLPPSGNGLVLVTSRQRLSNVWNLELDVPPPAEAAALLREYESTENLAKRCGCLPLALRLAAGVTELPLAPCGPETALATVLNASYEELDSRARRLLRAIGAFPGPQAGAVDLAAMTGFTVDETAELLRGLAEVGLLDRVDDHNWRAHDLVRAYARQRCEQDDAPEADLRRLLDWYVPATSRANAVAFGTAADGAKPAPGLPVFAAATEALGWLDCRYPSLLAAVRQGAKHGSPGQAAHLASDLFRYFSVHGYIEEWIDVTAVALEAARAAGDRKVEVRLSLNLGYACWDSAKVDEAHENFQHALAVSQELRDRDSQASVLGVLSGVNITLGRYLRAYEYASVALTMGQSLNNPVGEAIASENLGIVDLLRGNNGQAIRLLERSLALYRRHKVRLIEPDAHCELARAVYRDGDLEAAASHAELAVRMFSNLDDGNGAAWARSRLALITGARGDITDALENHRRALAVMLRAPRNEYKAEALNNAGLTYAAAGQTRWAIEFHHEAAIAAQRISCGYEKARALNSAAAAYRSLGERAEEFARQAHELFTRLGAAEARRS